MNGASFFQSLYFYTLKKSEKSLTSIRENMMTLRVNVPYPKRSGPICALIPTGRREDAAVQETPLFSPIT